MDIRGHVWEHQVSIQLLQTVVGMSKSLVETLERSYCIKAGLVTTLCANDNKCVGTLIHPLRPASDHCEICTAHMSGSYSVQPPHADPKCNPHQIHIVSKFDQYL
ncbi:hypothetical protein XENOCAPTIV_007899 [Xenoophorus captivus]|uniref:Uncharacterized protein n=1 Tax=Xenoophorus captivus TaxID=1517983 RepID=A0ABV0SE11_9TELE